jgi:hypothetical protein
VIGDKSPVAKTNSDNEFVVGQSPAGKNVNTEAEDIVGIRYQSKTGEDSAD